MRYLPLPQIDYDLLTTNELQLRQQFEHCDNMITLTVRLQKYLREHCTHTSTIMLGSEPYRTEVCAVCGRVVKKHYKLAKGDHE